MRACVVPREAHYLIDADFVSIEPAVLAWVVEDKEWMTCFEQGYDVHAALKQAITTKVPELPVELARGQAKELGLKVLYGMGDTKLSVGLEAMGLGAVTPKVLREAVSEAYPEYLGFTSDLSDAAWLVWLRNLRGGRLVLGDGFVGLDLVRHRVSELDGQLRLATATGKGTQFKVLLKA